MIQTKNLQYKSFPFQQKYQEVSAVPGTGLESTHSTTSKSGCAPITAAAASLSPGLKDGCDVGSCEDNIDRILSRNCNLQPTKTHLKKLRIPR